MTRRGCEVEPWCVSRCQPSEGVSLPPQRACYLSINPQKDETLETEKVQYTLPDGSTLDVSGRAWPWVTAEVLGPGGGGGLSASISCSEGGTSAIPGP